MLSPRQLSNINLEVRVYTEAKLNSKLPVSSGF